MFTTKLQQITPALAGTFLKDNLCNRKVRMNHVNRLKTEILAGRWMITHQGIAFDEDGKLLDGQHRLMAIQAAGKPVQMLVTRGIQTLLNGHGSLAAMDVIDCGKTRTVGDQLHLLHGIVNSNLVAAVCRMINIMLTADSQAARTQTVGQALGVMKIYGEHITRLIEVAQAVKLVRNSPIIAGCAIAAAIAPEITYTFFQQLSNGSGIKAGDPVYALREYIIKFGMGSNREDRNQTLLRTTLAIYHTIEGTNITTSKVGKMGLEYFMSKQPKNVQKIKDIVLGNE